MASLASDTSFNAASIALRYTRTNNGSHIHILPRAMYTLLRTMVSKDSESSSISLSTSDLRDISVLISLAAAAASLNRLADAWHFLSASIFGSFSSMSLTHTVTVSYNAS